MWCDLTWCVAFVRFDNDRNVCYFIVYNKRFDSRWVIYAPPKNFKKNHCRLFEPLLPLSWKLYGKRRALNLFIVNMHGVTREIKIPRGYYLTYRYLLFFSFSSHCLNHSLCFCVLYFPCLSVPCFFHQTNDVVKLILFFFVLFDLEVCGLFVCIFSLQTAT